MKKHFTLLINLLSLCFLSLFLLSCTAGPSDVLLDYYESEELDENEYVRVAKGSYIPVIETYSLEKIVQNYKNNGYLIIGTASFNGRWFPRNKLVEHARDIGASLIVVTSEYSDNTIHMAQIPYVKNNTIYHQGSINTTGNTYGNISMNGTRVADYTANSHMHTNYSGTSSYQTVDYMAIPVEIRKFDQKVVFMALANGESL